MFVARNFWPHLFTALAIPVVLLRSAPGRVALLGLALLSAAFVLSPAYWNQYNSALVPFELLVLGAGLNVLFEARRWWIAALAICAGALPSRRLAIAQPAWNGPQLESVGPLREVKSELCSFECAELVLADRLPLLRVPVLVDSYGQMLLDARGVRAASVDEVFASEASQVTFRKQLEFCPALHTGPGGDRKMNASTKALVDAQFRAIGDGLFERR
jgi:hypothetical protein